MKQRITALILVGGILIAGPEANAAIGRPSIKTQGHLKTMIYAPGPITPTPISVKQVCQVVQTVMGITGFWQSLGKQAPVWITIPVYGSSIVCTNIFF